MVFNALLVSNVSLVLFQLYQIIIFQNFMQDLSIISVFILVMIYKYYYLPLENLA